MGFGFMAGIRSENTARRTSYPRPMCPGLAMTESLTVVRLAFGVLSGFRIADVRADMPWHPQHIAGHHNS